MKSTAALSFGMALAFGATVLSGCPKVGQKCAGATTLCGTDCFDLTADTNHCGACGNACGTGEVCQTGCCQPGLAGHDTVAACYWTGQVFGVQSSTLYVGAVATVATTSQALAQMGPVILLADGTSPSVYELNGVSLAPLPETLTVGGIPNQMVTDAGTLYVVNSANNALDVFTTTGPAANGGLGLQIKNTLSFGGNTDPYAIALNGNDLWVALYGGYGSDAGYLQGQKVVRVPVGDPSTLAVAETIDLSGVNLFGFDGGNPIARPASLLVRNGGLYVGLNNLNPDYSPAGPGVVARIDLTNKAVTTLNLGADACVNAGALAALGTGMIVSCGGQVQYDSSFNALGSAQTGVVLLGPTDERLSTWNVNCPVGTVADGGCIPPSIGHVAVKNNRIFAADNSAGNIYVLDLEGTQLVERRGYGAEADAGSVSGTCGATQFGPINACKPGGPYNQASVSDILSLQ